jgi:hypothetical protein
MTEPKYVKINGMLQKNPKYFEPGAKSTLPPGALVPVTSVDDVMQYNSLQPSAPIQLADRTMATVQILQEPEFTDRYARKGHVDVATIVDGLSNAFKEREIPLGLLNKLVELVTGDYRALYVLDDSGSMITSDCKDEQGKRCTRWEETKFRILRQMKIFMYLPCRGVKITFLNRKDVINVDYKEHSPESFYSYVEAQMNKSFTTPPSCHSSTPIKERLATLLTEAAADQGNTIIYLFTDGEPDGGDMAKNEIERMLVNRDAKKIPVSLISCSGDNSSVQWMKELEERVSYVSESDDYESERDEILRDQGDAFPFTVGMWDVCQLCSAINPEDLDALDESIPITLYSLNNILGRELSIEEYNRYYDCFLNNPRQDSAMRSKLNAAFGHSRDVFIGAQNRNTFPCVLSYRQVQNIQPPPAYPPPPYY